MSNKYNIAEHWDTDNHINYNSDPLIEFELWKKNAASCADWEGNEFELADFRAYVSQLQDEAAHRLEYRESI